MPVIHIDFNSEADEKSIRALSEALHRIVSEATSIEDVPVYARRAPIQVKTSPIEVFVEMSEHKIPDLEELTADIRKKLIAWKKENNFHLSVNLSLIPMRWKIEIGI